MDRWEKARVHQCRASASSPAYPAITSSFSEAMVNITTGANVKKELDKAVQEIDQDIKVNQGYPTG